MGAKPSKMSNTPFTEDTSSATVAGRHHGRHLRETISEQIGRSSGIAGGVRRGSRRHRRSRRRQEAAGRPPPASSSPSPSLASSPSLHTRWLPTPEENHQPPDYRERFEPRRRPRRASRATRSTTKLTPEELPACAPSPSSLASLEGFVSSASANDAGPSGRCARIHRPSPRASPACSAAADVGLKDVIAPPGRDTLLRARRPPTSPTLESIGRSSQARSP